MRANSRVGQQMRCASEVQDAAKFGVEAVEAKQPMGGAEPSECLAVPVSCLSNYKVHMKRILIAVLAATISSGACADIVGRASVLDGDTIEIHGQRIRLHGIDAPEKGQPCFDAAGKSYRCGQEAAMTLDDFIGVSPVQCRERDVDRYGRIVADCSVRGQDIELWLVRNGHAMAYRRYSSDYIGAEQEAKNAKRGIWAGQVQPPWEWRKDRRGGS